MQTTCTIKHRWSDNRKSLKSIRMKRQKNKILVKEGVKASTENSDINSPLIMLDDYISKVLFFMFILSNNIFNSIVRADEMTGLGMIFNTDAFVGNTKWLEKFNIVGEVVQASISIFGMLIAVILFGQILVTLIYFVARPFWDTVAQVKEAETGSLNYLYKTVTGGKSNLSKGSDIIMTNIMLLCPNVKKYSEMGSDSADQNWTFTTWLMDTFLTKCFLMLIISMTINGSLMQAYMVVVDGMGVLATNFVEFNSEEFVQGLLNKAGSGYNFAVGSTGQGYDKALGEIAQGIYKQSLKKLKGGTTDERITLGSNIENFVTRELSKERIEAAVLPRLDSPLTDEEWGKLKIETVVNNTSQATNAITVSGDQIGLKDAGNGRLYIHLYFTLSSRSNSTNYWELRTNE